MTASRCSDNHDVIPIALRSKVPGVWIPLLEVNTRIAMNITLLFISFLIHFGSFLAPPLHRQLGNVLDRQPWSTGFCLLVHRFPVQSVSRYASRARWHERPGSKGQDRPGLCYTSTVLRSSTFLLKLSVRLSIVLLAPMVIISALAHRTPIWRFGFECFLGVPVFVFVCLFLLFRVELLAWSVRSWKRRDERYQMSR